MRNRLGIHQTRRLAQAACEPATLRTAIVELRPLRRDLPHLYAIHHRLYRDIFDRAGHLREVDIYQGDIRSYHFAYIEREDNALMQDLEDKSWLVGLPEDKFVDRLVHYYCEISVPYLSRIGSGLAQRTFFEQLAIHAGYMLSWGDTSVEEQDQVNRSGAMGDLFVPWAISRKAVSETPKTEQNSAVLVYQSHHDPAY